MKKEQEHYKQLLRITQSLTDKEFDIALQYIQTFGFQNSKEKVLASAIFKMIRTRQISFKKLSNQLKESAVRLSRKRLIDSLLFQVEESFLNDQNITDHDTLNRIYKQQFILEKKLIGSFFYFNKGLIKDALFLIENIIENAKAYELYSILKKALYAKLAFGRNGLGVEQVELLIKEQKHAEYCEFALSRIRLEYEPVIFRANLFLAPSSDSLIELLKVVKYYYKKTKSETIYSYYLKIQFDIAMIDGNISQERRSAQKLHHLVKKSQILYSKARLTLLKLRLAEIEVFTLNFQSALNLVNESLMFYKSTSSQLYFSLLLEKYKACIYSFRLDELVKLDTVIAKPKERNGFLPFKIFESKFSYLKGVGYFLKSKFLDSLKLFEEVKELEKDKDGWNIYIRIMRLLCWVELKEATAAQSGLESFRKFLSRNKETVHLSQRNTLILEVIKELVRSYFNFRKTAEKKAEALILLQSTEKPYAWNPDSPELILFHEWFKAKQHRRDYQPDFERYRKGFNTKKLLV